MIHLAKISHSLTRAYLDQYDVSGLMNTASLNLTQETPMVTTFADTGPRRLPANYDYTAMVGGFFDGAEDSLGGDTNIDALIFGLTSAVDHVLTIVPVLTQGLVSYDGLVANDGQPRKFQQGQAVMLDANFQGSNGLSRGLVLRTATVTGTGNGTGYNQGATTAGQVYAAVFRVLSGTFDQVILKIQESSDDAAGDAYADISGLTATFSTDDTAAVSRVTTVAATEAWKRCVVSGFTGTSAVILVTAGVVART